jgi:hypothetical protein
MKRGNVTSKEYSTQEVAERRELREEWASS